MNGSNLMSKKDIMAVIVFVQKNIAKKEFSKTIQIGLFFLIICLMIFFHFSALGGPGPSRALEFPHPKSFLDH